MSYEYIYICIYQLTFKLEMNTLIAILPDLSRNKNADNSTLVGEDTVDEGIIVLQKKKKTDRIFYIKRGKRNGWEENVETFAN